ncbi:hypothetical protein LINPERHAP1_LOCUS11398 [Linum perenne]
MVNCRQHILELKAQYPRATPRIIQVRHNSTFQAWFAQQIREGNVILPTANIADLQHLARSPNNIGRKFNGYIVDGYRFHTKEGLKEDDYGFTLVNFSHRMSDLEPFILASQTQQVFYVADPMNEDWKVVIKTTPRNLCNMTEEEQVAEADDYLQSQTVRVPLSEDLSHEDNIHWTRTEINGDLVDAPIGFSTLEPSSVLETEEGNEDEEDELEEYAY